MKKIIAVLALSLLIGTDLLLAQDVIKTNNGTEIKAKVVDMTYFTIIYKATDGKDSSLVTLPKSSISKITFANGKEETFSSTSTSTTKDTTAKVASANTTEDLYTRGATNTTTTQQPTVNTTPNSSNDYDLLKKGERDAEVYYTNYKGGAIGTGAAAFCAGPCLGLIPAIAITNSTVKDENLGFPDRQLMKKEAYSKGYRDAAQRKKVKQTWKGYAVGSGILVGATIVFYVLLFTLSGI